jgi:hypothetical protein
MRWAGHVARTGGGDKRSSCKENPDGRHHYGNLCVNGKIMLKLILEIIMRR